MDSRVFEILAVVTIVVKQDVRWSKLTNDGLFVLLMGEKRTHSHGDSHGDFLRLWCSGECGLGKLRVIPDGDELN
jgi:hypothetical protein